MLGDPLAGHPIQANFIIVREIRFVIFRTFDKNENLALWQLAFSQTVPEYDETRKTVQISLKVDFGFQNEKDNPQPPYGVTVAILGEFRIVESFPKEKALEWAAKAAPYVLFPYLRQQLQDITSRSGAPPLIIPLLLLPTFKIQTSNPKTELEIPKPN